MLFESNSRPPVIVRTLPPLSLPLNTEHWNASFEKHFREVREVQAAYDAVRACELEFSAEELGAIRLRCEREFTPLRWLLRTRGQVRLLRLLDDVGSATKPAISRIAFEMPALEESLHFQSEYQLPSTGGLYIARAKQFEAAIVVPPSIRDLSDLACAPRLDIRDRSFDGLLRLIRLAASWRNAKLPGNYFSVLRQRQVLHAITLHIFRIIGGDAWADAEIGAHDGDKRLTNFSRAVYKRHEEAVVGSTLLADCAALASSTLDARVRRIASIVSKYFAVRSQPIHIASHGAGDPTWLAEFALRLASNPADIEVWAAQSLRPGIVTLLELPTLARAARFLVLATDRHLNSRVGPGELYAGWKWS